MHSARSSIMRLSYPPALQTPHLSPTPTATSFNVSKKQNTLADSAANRRKRPTTPLPPANHIDAQPAEKHASQRNPTEEFSWEKVVHIRLFFISLP